MNVVVVFAESKPVAVFPIYICKRHGLETARWIGGDQSDYGAPLLVGDCLAPQPAFAAAWEMVMNTIDDVSLVHLSKLPASVGRYANPIVKHLRVRARDKFVYAELPPSWDEYVSKQLGRKVVNDANRQFKRLQEKGTIRFSIAQTADEALKITAEMLKQKERRLLETKANNFLRRKEVRDFYMAVPLQLSHDCRLHCSALYVGDQIVATHWGVVHRKRFYYMMPTHEGGEWQKFSCGRLLLQECVRWAIEQGLEIFDFTIGGESYKKVWCNREDSLYTLSIGRTLAGRMVERSSDLAALGAAYLRGNRHVMPTARWVMRTFRGIRNARNQ